MSSQKAQSITSLFSHHRLAELKNRIQHLRQLDLLLSGYLDKSLRDCCHVAALQEGTLVLITDNATAATRLRYLSRLYLQQLRQHREFADIAKIRVNVTRQSLPNSGTVKARNMPRPLSSYAQMILDEAAEGIDDPELSAALRKLARRGRSPTNGSNPK